MDSNYNIKNMPRNDNELTNIISSGNENTFLFRVYLLITLQLMMTTGLVYFYFLDPTYLLFMRDHFYFFWIAFIAFFVNNFFIFSNLSRARRCPFSLFFFLMSVLPQSYMFSLSCISFKTQDVLNLFIIASAAYFGMSFYAASSKSIIRIRNCLISGIIGMGLAVGLMSLYLGDFNLNMIFSTIGVALSLVFVSIDS